MEWLPIESAPKDGATVLLWAPAWESPKTGWTYGKDPWQECPYGGGKPEWNPTHWMPLPPPPKDEQK